MRTRNDAAHAADARRRLDTHLPPLDGLRGVAILLILAVHLLTMGGGVPQTAFDHVLYQVSLAGWSGVPLFFVLSGFLITGLLHDARARGDGLATYYARRALRIFPLYYGVLLFYFVVFPWFGQGPAAAVRANAGHLWCKALYLGEWTKAFGGHDHGGIPHFGHFWSLEVEEHFYLVWPFVVWFASRRAAMGVCGLLVVGSLAFRLAWNGAGGNPGVAWVLDFSHLDSLAVGGLIALAARGPGGIEALEGWARRGFTLSAVALAFLFGYMRQALHVDWRFQVFGWTPMAVFFGSTLVLVILAPRRSWTGAVFHSRVLRFFGTYSYGLYVYHAVLFWRWERWFPTGKFQHALGSYSLAVLLHFVLATAASVAIAWVSYHTFERPFLRLKAYVAYRPAPDAVPGPTSAPAPGPHAATRPVTVSAPRP